ncbi:hypothetical protein KFK09_023023 [Dendrobium nobile]|uniref:Uncharacterized protein n=1 Tax=Dendrobium nobile TaxID=94219 RepID=A0A8T3AJV9_DENNO|nr:hypothetical protein KFK09_023023 [Dendrobium nobile]
MSTRASGRSAIGGNFHILCSGRQGESATISHPSVIQAFRRRDFHGFARRVVSDEALRNVWKSATEGIE